MGLGQVLDVDVVADRRAVAGRVVGAEDGDVVALAHGRAQDVGDEVGLGVVVLAQPAAGPRDVEVAQRDRVEAVAAALVADHHVHGELGGAVGALGPGRRGLVHGHAVGRAVGGAGGGEHQPRHLRRPQRVEQVARAAHVRAPVALGVLDRLAHQGQRGEVQGGVAAGVDLGRDGVGIAQVGLTNVAPAGMAARCPRSSESSTVTSCPRPSSRAATTLPMYPAPPVTRSRMSASWRIIPAHALLRLNRCRRE